MARIGIIGDTHGFLPAGVARVFQGVERIIHAGDVGDIAVIRSLERIAPVTGVRGNYDTSPELAQLLLPDPSGIEIAGLPAMLTHRMFTLGWNENKQTIASLMAQGPSPPRLVVFGHTHFSVCEELHGIWFINPGYCGPDPLEGPKSVAVLTIEDDRISARIIPL
ncbi:MAG TPA: metallophosphoesterase family protein [bacterium]|nr:metallophosphoesterase family protein [bacterium]